MLFITMATTRKQPMIYYAKAMLIGIYGLGAPNLA